MRIAINALSVDNPSGRYVLRGHLRQWAQWNDLGITFVVLYRDGNADLQEDLGPAVEWYHCSLGREDWSGRAFWEQRYLAQTIDKLGVSICLTPSGIAGPVGGVPQWVLALNPWCLVPQVHRRFTEKFKAALQRAMYRRTVRRADKIFYLSSYLQGAYLENAGESSDPGNGEILYLGLDNDLLDLAEGFAAPEKKRDGPIVSVSVFGSHKNVDCVISAYKTLKEKGEDRSLELVGGWPDANYRAEIVAGLEKSGLQDCVRILGHVSRAELLDAYRRASVFVLMSRCESFGIPAVEAQAFGTPVVTSNCCAIPEICGEGGLYLDPDDFQGVAEQVRGLLDNGAAWTERSAAARKNASRFRWEEVAKPMFQHFQQLKSLQENSVNE